MYKISGNKIQVKIEQNATEAISVKSQGQGHRHGRKHALASQEKSAGFTMFPETRQYFKTKGKQQHYQGSNPMV
jgi:hypothetical protein